MSSRIKRSRISSDSNYDLDHVHEVDDSSNGSRQSGCSTSDQSVTQVSVQGAADEEPTCIFCKSSENNLGLYGEKRWFDNDKLKSREYVHYSCLLFASGLEQRGSPDRGIYGFLVNDILKEKGRGNQLKCSYCTVSGATVGCNNQDCSIKYHLACAMAQPSSIRPSISYVDPFRSFCGAHRPPRKLHSVHLLNERGTSRCICPICHDRVKILPNILYEVIQCPHCAQLIHIDCLRGWAHSAGRAHFKCPACNCRRSDCSNENPPMSEDDPDLPRIPVAPTGGYSDVLNQTTGEPLLYSHTLLVREKRIDRLKLTPEQCQRLLIGHCLENGVNVPAKDADWELDRVRLQSDNESGSPCTAPHCMCPRGTKYYIPLDAGDEDDEASYSPWNMLLCALCEGMGMHRRCFTEFYGHDVVFKCDVCKNLSLSSED